MRFCLALVFTSILLLAPAPAHAEYRVFELNVANSTTGASYSVTSVLDDIQFPMYYPVASVERVTIVATWMCWGRHGDFKRLCANPRAKS